MITTTPSTIDALDLWNSLEISDVESLLSTAELSLSEKEELIGAMLSRPVMGPETPADLASIVMPTIWQNPRHLRLLNSKLVQVANNELHRLIITMPPRHGKSTLTSHIFPAWYVGRYPDRRVMLASYEAEFAADWGRLARNVLEEHGENLFDVSISKTSSAANRWHIQGYRGGMQTAGVGGPLTGKGADLLIIDDPIKNSEEAASETIRNKLWEWFRTTAYTRLQPKGAAVIIQTRWHEDDLAGRILAAMREWGQDWELLNLPAIAEPGDVLGRKIGEALWPEQYPREELLKIQKVQGSRNWASLYQQRPTPEDGDVFKRSWFRRYTKDGDTLVTKDGRFRLRDCSIFATMDLAISEKTSADYTVIQAWAVTECNRAFLLGQVRDRVKSGQHIPILRAMVKRYRCDWVGIESVAFQFEIVRQARQAGLTVKKLVPKGDKITRAHAAAPRMEAGMVYFPDDEWIGDLESELLTFPNGKHDDQVDALAYALLDIHRRAGGLEAA